MLPLLFIAVALAAPVGDPVAAPEVERVRVVVRGDMDQTEVIDQDCPRDGRCAALWNRDGAELVVQGTLVRGVAVFAQLGYPVTRSKQADYRGQGLDTALGLKLALPLGQAGWWVGAQGRYQWGQGEGGALAGGGQETADYAIGTASLLGAWRESSGGVQVWGGAQAAWSWDHHIQPLGEVDGAPVLDVSVRPALPASAMLGGSLTSEPLGTGFNRSARLTIGMEGRVGQTTGASAWMGVLY